MGLQTPLHQWHSSSGGRLVDFAGWQMPIVYSSIQEEHQATRQAAGLFDIGHMGRLRFEGKDAVRFLDHVLTNRVDTLAEHQVRYALVLSEEGGTLDDVLVTRCPDHHLLVVNASNREKLLAWFTEKIGSFDATMTDETLETAMIACQGPAAVKIASEVVEDDLDSMGYYTARPGSFAGSKLLVSRTGYTGEDGFEFIVRTEIAEWLWRALLEVGSSHGIHPAALGARDTLRLEAGMPLYGHELDETIDPLQVGLAWAVKSKSKDFIGKDALAQRDPVRPVRVGLELQGRKIPREGYEVLDAEGTTVGRVTSGSFTPTLQRSIAMAFVPPALAEIGTSLSVAVRGDAVPGTVVALPFYQRKKA
ncbi:Glycine cleavage system T protein [Planctomycetes bacterium Pan216]|uniref:Aminomethyltransferase n=1 Tax=Kolteria novifilia TaxID=2527975 RepID=A0A518B1N2_9BACT|nr:Glycine cleavage system T protein [Planctomycetes bacterium Pan216]